MLASGSLASASTAASRIAASLRSASARRRLLRVAGWCWLDAIYGLVDSYRRGELQLRQEALCGGKDRQCGDARDAGDYRRCEKRVADPVGDRRDRRGAVCVAEGSGRDRGQHGETERAADLVTGVVQ